MAVLDMIKSLQEEIQVRGRQLYENNVIQILPKAKFRNCAIFEVTLCELYFPFQALFEYCLKKLTSLISQELLWLSI